MNPFVNSNSVFDRYEALPNIEVFLQIFLSVLFNIFLGSLADMVINEPPHDKTKKMACVPSEDSDQPWHLPNLIRVFAVGMKKAWVLSYPLSAQQSLWSDWADAQAEMSLCWAHNMPFRWVLSWGSSNK